MLLSFLLFILTFILTVYGVEYVLDPFGQFLFKNPVEIIGSLAFSIAYVTGVPPKISIQFLFKNPVEIIGSLAFSIAYVTGVPPKISIFIGVAILAIPAIILVILFNRRRKNKRKKKLR